MIGILTSNGYIQFIIPGKINNFFQMIVGTYIAIELLRCDRKYFLTALRPSFLSALFAGLFTLITAFLLSKFIGCSFSALALSFAPGGAEAMIILAVIFNVDPSFVGIHHTIRLLVLTLIFPILVSYLLKKRLPGD
jgi:membrane AbrB-like protein